MDTPTATTSKLPVVAKAPPAPVNTGVIEGDAPNDQTTVSPSVTVRTGRGSGTDSR